jgi:putative hydrolase of the HAD superfamily
VAEKTESAYKEIVAKYEFEPQTTWMIGNSPKSDINPALAAGIHAILVPHQMTWVLEYECLIPVISGQRFLQVDRFVDLRKIF